MNSKRSSEPGRQQSSVDHRRTPPHATNRGGVFFVRRLQIASVAIGSCGALAMLAGLAGGSVWITRAGFSLFAICLFSVLFLGLVVWRWVRS